MKDNEIEGVVFDVYEFELDIIDDLKLFNNVVLILYIGNVIFEVCDMMFKIVVNVVISVV